MDSLDSELSSHDVVFFDMAWCPYCRKAEAALVEAGFLFKKVPIAGYKAALRQRTGATSAPSVWIKGTYVGGCNDGTEPWHGVRPMIRSGKFQEMLAAVKPSQATDSMQQGAPSKAAHGGGVAHCHYKKDKATIPVAAGADVAVVISTHFNIPFTSLKLVVKGKIVELAQSTPRWLADPGVVFYVVGNPLTAQQIEQAAAVQRATEAGLERAEAKRVREEGLRVREKEWEKIEIDRLEQLRVQVARRRVEREKNRGVCERVASSLLALPSAVSKVPGVGTLLNVFDGVVFFLRSIVAPTRMPEAEALRRAREEEDRRWNPRRNNRGVNGLDRRPRSNLTTPSGG